MKIYKAEFIIATEPKGEGYCNQTVMASDVEDAIRKVREKYKVGEPVGDEVSVRLSPNLKTRSIIFVNVGSISNVDIA